MFRAGVCCQVRVLSRAFEDLVLMESQIRELCNMVDQKIDGLDLGS